MHNYLQTKFASLWVGPWMIIHSVVIFWLYRPIPGSSLVAPPISRPISKLANKENQLDTDKENDEVVPDDNVDNPVTDN